MLVLLLAVVAAATGSWLGREWGGNRPEERVRVHEAAQRPAPARLAPGGDRRHAAVAPAPASVSASGHVVDRVGRPVEGAEVTWAPTGGGPKTTVVTAPDGSFHLEAIPDRIDLQVVAPDGRRAWRWCVACTGREPFWIRVQDVAPLRGTVRSGTDGAAVAGAVVTASGWGFGTVESRTRTDGSFALDVPRHTRFDLRVEAEARGRRLLRDVVWGRRGHLEITLPRVRTLHGRVVRRDEQGAALGVGGVHVRAWTLECTYYGGISGHPMEPCGAGVETEADGSFAYEGLTRSGLLFVLSDRWELVPSRDLYRRGYGWSWDEDVTLVVRRTEKRQAATVEAGTEPAGSVASACGQVLDEHGRPIRAAEVRAIWVERRPRGGNLLRSLKGRTDAHGRFRLDGLPAVEVDLQAETPGFDAAWVRGVRPCAEGTAVPPIHLEPLVACTGRVTDRLGRPLATASYGVSRGRPRSGRPVDAEGRFLIEVPREGDFTLEVDAPGFLDLELERDARPPEGEWVIALEPAPVLCGRVLDTQGNPVCPARVGTDGPPWISTWDGASTDPDGTFRLEVPEPGTYTVAVEAEGMVFRPKHGVETGTEDSVLQASVPCTIAGRVVAPPGVTLPLLVVHADPEDGGRSRCDVTDVDGHFCVEGLAGETFRLYVRFDDEDLIARGLLVVPLNGVPAWSEGVVLEAIRGWSLAGRVVWPDGTPAADVTVYAATDVEDYFVAAQATYEDGTFEFCRLLPGSYRVHAHEEVELREPVGDDDDGESAYYESDTVEVKAGSTGTRLRLRLRPDDDE